MTCEPQPVLKIPPSAPPTIRVGLVLPEDIQEDISISSPKELTVSTSLSAAASNRDTQHTGSFSVKLEKGEKSLLLIANNGEKAEKFTISGSTALQMTPVPVGRGFHWQTTKTFEYLGNLEVSAGLDSIQVVNSVFFEDYVACVVTSEMGKDCPLEFAKAQMIAARSWAYVFMGSKHPGSGFDVCNDDDCQRYQGVSFLSDIAKRARDETYGQYLLDAQGFVVPAYYAKTCGGMSEPAAAMLGVPAPGIVAAADTVDGKVWDLSEEDSFKNYLSSEHSSVFCSGMGRDEPEVSHYLGAVDKGGIFFRWQKTVTVGTLVDNLLRLNVISAKETITAIEVKSRSVSGRIQKLAIIFANGMIIELLSQYAIRQALSPDFLYSSAFDFSFNKDPSGQITEIKFDGLGWGHGVGLCQVGALVQALEGRTSEQILGTYFPKATLVKAY